MLIKVIIVIIFLPILIAAAVAVFSVMLTTVASDTFHWAQSLGYHPYKQSKSSVYHEKIPWSELYSKNSEHKNVDTWPDSETQDVDDNSDFVNAHTSNPDDFSFSESTQKIKIETPKNKTNADKEKEQLAKERENFKKIQAEYLEAERLKNEAKVEKQKAKIAHEEAETEKERARLAREKAEELKQNAFREWEKSRKDLNASKNEMGDPYSVLGVHKTDSFETIKNVYKQLVQIYHPDKYAQSNDTAKQQKNDKTTRINAAYDWIKKHHGHS